MGDVVGGGNIWNLTFRRKLFVWSDNLILESKHVLRVQQMYYAGSGKESGGVFSVSSEDTSTHTIYLNLIWRNVCPIRIEIFIRLGVQNRIATRGLSAE